MSSLRLPRNYLDSGPDRLRRFGPRVPSRRSDYVEPAGWTARSRRSHQVGAPLRATPVSWFPTRARGARARRVRQRECGVVHGTGGRGCEACRSGAVALAARRSGRGREPPRSRPGWSLAGADSIAAGATATPEWLSGRGRHRLVPARARRRAGGFAEIPLCGTRRVGSLSRGGTILSWWWTRRDPPAP